MKQPLGEPDFSGQSKIICYTEGNPSALLITNKMNRRTTKAMQFATAELALAWCRANLAMMIYLSADPARN